MSEENPIILTPDSNDMFEMFVNRKAASLFVIMNKERDNLLMDPVTRKPYYSSNRKMAEHVCKSCPPGSFVTDGLSAFEHLKKVSAERIRVMKHLKRD